MPQIISNISRIASIEAHRLRNITVIPGMGVMLNYWRDFAELPLASLASMEVSSKVENKSRLFTTTLKALLLGHFDIANRKLCYLVTTVLGERYLVGTDESPFPVSNTTDNFPDKPSDTSGCTLSVEYTDNIGLLPVLD